MTTWRRELLAFVAKVIAMIITTVIATNEFLVWMGWFQ